MDDITDRIKDLWNEGQSAGQIASILHISRNSVMGRIHRLRAKNLVRYRVQPKDKKSKTPAKTKPIKRKGRVVQVRLKSKKQKAPEPIVQQIFVPQPSRRYPSILELKTYDCRYIVAEDPDRGLLYCGAPQENRSYCDYHAKLCFIKVKSKDDFTIKSANAS